MTIWRRFVFICPIVERALRLMECAIRYSTIGQSASGVILTYGINNKTGSSYYADLERISTERETGNDASLYSKNMLVGVTEPTTIGKTDGDKTNFILKDGAFHPTSGGTVKANKAYLQIPTASLAREGALTISFDEEESTGVNGVSEIKEVNDNSWYDLQGRRVGSAERNSSLFTLHFPTSRPSTRISILTTSTSLRWWSAAVLPSRMPR